ncbi:MAG: substrate-binding domain-containing protein [Lentimicrobiaceae bacterium]|nr:substrate-binding domain-containing protein [Lentimicrobiaceae bacterium]MCB9023022.1 substrate-binding domain-containing protein [Lentimicrobiaceae bacterium]MCO5264547.1 substrate-binding domain-containing protein [Lentimicrobium sp.]
MKKAFFIGFVTAAIMFSSCASQKKKDSTISLSGAFALYPLAVKWTEEYQKIHPEIRFNVSGGGAGKGMADALAGTVDLGMFSREISQEEINQGVWWVGLTIDAVVPTINVQNPFLNDIKQKGLSKEDFKSIFIDGNVKSWGQLLQKDQDEKIVIYTRSDACGAAETWAKYLGGKQEDLLGIGIYGDPGLADAVAQDKLGVGFNNTIFAYDINTGKKRPGMEIIPIDINGNGKIDPEEDFYETFDGVLKAIADGVYPSPPARELYFVSKGKPQKQATLDFIQWVLTDGQKFVKEAGYVPIDQEKINNYLNKIK